MSTFGPLYKDKDASPHLDPPGKNGGTGSPSRHSGGDGDSPELDSEAGENSWWEWLCG